MGSGDHGNVLLAALNETNGEQTYRTTCGDVLVILISEVPFNAKL